MYFGENMTKRQIDMLLNWGPIIGVAFFPVQTYILGLRGGLKRGIELGILLGFFGNVLRTVPILLADSSVLDDSCVQTLWQVRFTT